MISRLVKDYGFEAVCLAGGLLYLLAGAGGCGHAQRPIQEDKFCFKYVSIFTHETYTNCYPEPVECVDGKDFMEQAQPHFRVVSWCYRD